MRTLRLIGPGGLRITLLAAMMGFLANMDSSYGNPVGVPEPNILLRRKYCSAFPNIRIGVAGHPGGLFPMPWPDVYLFGGGYDRGRDVHDYRRRGAESRGAAHRDHGGPERRR